MKNLILTLFLLASINLTAQTDGISYQAVIIGPDNQELPGVDAEGNILSNTTVAIRFTILDANSQVEYQEVQTTNTDQYGRINLLIGEVDPDGFAEISWDGTNKDLKVEIDFNGGTSYVDMTREKLTFLPYAYHRNITATGTLTVEGFAKFNDNVEITKDLLVGRDVFLNYNDTISPRGQTINNGNFTVENQSSTLLTGSLKVGTKDAQSNTKLNGQVTIFANGLDGTQDDLSAYPLRVSGGTQGIAIKVDNKFPHPGNNFVTFFANDDKAVGRIEGRGLFKQVFVDIVTSIVNGEEGGTYDGREYEYLNPDDLRDLKRTYFLGEFPKQYMEKTFNVIVETVKLIIEIIPAIAPVAAGFPPCVAGDCDDIVGSAVELVKLKAQRRWFVVNYLATEAAASGVTFESKGADYAEWLKKLDPNESISFGEVVGVKGGLISKKFKDADQYLAITSNPLIVGALPTKGDENKFMKVALMGQVPIAVVGQTDMGDYILPSGDGDGTAKSVNPNKMLANDYSKIIGVAWSSSNPNEYLSYINTAVGFNTNHMGSMINNMQTVMNTIQEELVKINPDYKPVLFHTSESRMIQPVQTTKRTLIDKNILNQNSDASNLNSLTQKDIDKIVDKLIAASKVKSSCYDDCVGDWNLEGFSCFVNCALATENFNISGVNYENNFVIDLFSKSEKFRKVVKSRMATAKIMEVIECLVDLEKDFNDMEDVKGILIDIVNNGFYNDPVGGNLDFHNLIAVKEKYQDVLKIMSNLMKVQPIEE